MSFRQNIIKVFRDEYQVSILNKDYLKEITELLSLLRRHDESKNGDITSKICIKKDIRAMGTVICKGSGIFAGAQELKAFLDCFKNDVTPGISFIKNDGDRIKSGDILLTIQGNARQLLVIERTLLNLLQRMCGIASLTNEYVKMVPKNILICSTRKTVLGALDKRACFVGGGGTHRMNLGDAVMIKNNHINVFGGNYTELLGKLRNLRNGRFVDIEVRTDAEAVKVFEWITRTKNRQIKMPIVIMFDNFASNKLKALIMKLKKSFSIDDIILEASGGIMINNVSEYALSGVDIISIGELTHSVKALDLSMEIVPY